MDSQRIARDRWSRYIYALPNKGTKKVKNVSFNLKANDFTGALNLTDLQLQSGNQVTVQLPHENEFLKELTYNFDESTNIAGATADNGSAAIKRGVQPIEYTNMKNRAYNIVGRGHETIALPNVFHEDYTQELLTSGLDLELYAKEDFSWIRISTNDGTVVPDRMYDDTIFQNYYKDNTYHHPLNYKYSREFYLDGGKAGDKITLSCTDMTAFVGSTHFQYGQRAVGALGSRQRLPMAPYGSFRLRIEFYKTVGEYLGATDANGNPALTWYYKDVGIGFYGTAQFKQVQAAHLF